MEIIDNDLKAEAFDLVYKCLKEETNDVYSYGLDQKQEVLLEVKNLMRETLEQRVYLKLSQKYKTRDEETEDAK